MKRCILFTQEELEDLLNGCEIEYFITGFGYVYFMSKEHFVQISDGNVSNERNGEN